jgi:hypothetical protein
MKKQVKGVRYRGDEHVRGAGARRRPDRHRHTVDTSSSFVQNLCLMGRSRSFLVFLLLAGLVFPAGASAFSTTVQSDTYLQLRESISGKNLAPLYQYVSLDIENIEGREGLSFHTSGWLRVDLADDTAGDDYEDQLTYAYLSIRLPTRVTLNIGRSFVVEGVASEQVDGVYAKALLPANFDVAVYGGQRVDMREKYEEDFIWGARVSHTIPERYRIGLSFLKEDDEDGNDFREEGGVDLWVSAAATAYLQGLSSYNFDTDGWMEHSYHLNLGPYKDFRVNLTYSFVNYEDFFSKADLSAFSPVSLDPREEMQLVGARVDYTFKGSYTVTPEYRNYRYDIMGDADYYGAALRYLSGGYAAGASFHRMDGESDRLRYYQLRTGHKRRGHGPGPGGRGGVCLLGDHAGGPGPGVRTEPLL